MTVPVIKVTRALNQSSKHYPTSTELVRAELVLREEGTAYGTSKVRLKKVFITKGLRPRSGLWEICDPAETVCKTAYERGHVHFSKSVHSIHQLFKVACDLLKFMNYWETQKNTLKIDREESEAALRSLKLGAREEWQGEDSQRRVRSGRWGQAEAWSRPDGMLQHQL